MDILNLRIHFKQTSDGYLATVVMQSASTVRFHRVTISPDVNPYSLYGDIVASALQRLRAHSATDAPVAKKSNKKLGQLIQIQAPLLGQT